MRATQAVTRVLLLLIAGWGGLLTTGSALADEGVRPDPLACDARLMSVIEAFDDVARDFYGEFTACRLNPEAKQEAIVAYARMPAGALPDLDGNKAYQLHLMVIDVVSGDVLASLDDPSMIPSDGSRFESLSVDTGRYRLAPDVRAFGVRIAHGMTCHGCLYDEEELALYVRRGDAISKILPATHVLTRKQAPAPDCPDDVDTATTIVTPLATRQHGMADLRWKTSTKTESMYIDPDPGAEHDPPPPQTKACPVAKLSTEKTLRFDGQVYREAGGR